MNRSGFEDLSKAESLGSQMVANIVNRTQKAKKLDNRTNISNYSLSVYPKKIVVSSSREDFLPNEQTLYSLSVYPKKIVVSSSREDFLPNEAIEYF